eukprot:TRINITY_DN10708_c0_g2_i1.p1 TRINITY_DN10708_c0_g2~~TRINITY_DN10708_c0_g2_i1.p1  ORF type:complete len:187 (-),score=20.57 TRINITY_DN10708_c0_g2_i1:92-652(-)
MKASTLVMVIVFVCYLIAFGLAVGAEQRRSKAKIVSDENQDYNYCSYDSDRATGYGVGAFLFVLVGEALIMIATRCLCCGRSLRPGGSRAWTIVLFAGSVLTFIIAESCLLAGAAKNAYHTKYRSIVGGEDLSCETLRKGVFGAGAAFVIFNLILSELYYVKYGSAQDGGLGPYGRDSAIGMSNFA